MSLEKHGDPWLLASDGVAVIDRPFIRALVEKNAKETADALAAGLNVHQLALDQADRYERFLFSLQPGDDVKFLTLYHEEQDALTQAMLDKSRAEIQLTPIHTPNIQESNFAKWIGLITFFFVLFLLIRLLKM